MIFSNERHNFRGGALILIFALIVPIIIISLAAMSLQRASVMMVEHHAACVRARLSAVGKLAVEINTLERPDAPKPPATHADAVVREPIETIDGAGVSLGVRAELKPGPGGTARIKRLTFSETTPDAVPIKERP